VTIVIADDDAIARAAGAIRDGLLVVMPTETVYGLAGDATSATAVARIYAAKGRPTFNPLISHVLGLEQADRHGVFHPIAETLAEAFWPGPLTLVVRRRENGEISELACAGLQSVALRAPAHPVARALIAAAATPLAAPSANRSGRLSPTYGAHAAEDLGDSVALVLDAGPCMLGLESTVIALQDDGRATLLRPGAIARDDIERITGALMAPRASSTPASPGMLESHYAPRARLRLDVSAPAIGDAYLAFGKTTVTGSLNLSPHGDLVEAAANLFAYLRRLDATGVGTISVAPIPQHGLGEAINDRLARAAAGR
jgi:L-threonylcarbamoyladenylate synthase